MSIILLRGFSHSGKDFVGDILSRKYDYNRVAFADYLKIMVAESVRCPVEQLHSQKGKLKVCESDPMKRTYRQILIDEALRLRSIDAGVFAKKCCKEIECIGAEKVVITDWRYDNELEIITNMFPKMKVIPVHIIRTGQIKSPVDDISEYQLQHRTEDYVIHNNMDESIYKEIHGLIDFLGD
jgi:hypothetical protein